MKTDKPKLQRDLEAEIDKLIIEAISAGQVLDPDLVPLVILAKHPKVSGEDSDFYVHGAANHVRKG